MTRKGKFSLKVKMDGEMLHKAKSEDFEGLECSFDELRQKMRGKGGPFRRR